MTKQQIVAMETADLKELRSWVKAELKRRRSQIKKAPPKKRAELLEKYKERDRIRNWTLYTLYLNGGYYYVGITAYKTAKKRYEQHVNGKGAKWTQLHKPVGILSEVFIGRMRESEALKIETAKTIELINEHGISKVRGGKIVTMNSGNAQRLYNKNSLLK
jgi:predicted GIY-YIG superfamily endonuclease